MSEKSPIYNVGGVLPATLEAFKNRPCALHFNHQGYQPPTPQEVARLLELAGWSQNKTAQLVGVSWNPSKGSSTVRKWKAPSDKKDARPINYAAWRLLLLYSGVVAVGDALCVE